MNSEMSGHKGRERIAYLCAQGGSPNPTLSAIRLAKAMLSRSASGRLAPVNIDELCELRKVTPIEVYLTGFAGRLLSMGGRYIAEINARNPESRRRFTLGHEIGHTFFQDLTKVGESDASCGDESYAYMLEERLCDVFATEFLMPETQFRTRAMDCYPSMKSVRGLAGDFKVSMHAAMRRIIELGLWPATLLLFERRDNRLHFCRCSSSKSARLRRIPFALAVNVLRERGRRSGQIDIDGPEKVSMEYYTYGSAPHEYVCSLMVYR